MILAPYITRDHEIRYGAEKSAVYFLRLYVNGWSLPRICMSRVTACMGGTPVRSRVLMSMVGVRVRLR